jgi:hypothetical protein
MKGLGGLAVCVVQVDCSAGFGYAEDADATRGEEAVEVDGQLFMTED